MPHITRDGVKVFYESIGQGEPTIVFLHPWSTNHYIWANQLPIFAARHRCISMDHRGHGQSDKPADGYGIGEMAADVVAVLDECGVDKAVLVGNSIGGMIAMQTSLDAPERVIANLILSSGTNIGADTPPEVAEAMQQDWRAVFSGLLDSAVSAKSKADRPEIGQWMEACFRSESNFTEGVFWASMADPNGVFNWNISDRLKDISQPTMVIAGEEDGATTVAHNQFLADNIPNAEIKIYKDVAHFCQLEKPADFNADLDAFLKKVA
ncbi:MAG: alpha/beta fold hydrolase [Gammaproteobacteria bacterium]